MVHLVPNGPVFLACVVFDGVSPWPVFIIKRARMPLPNYMVVRTVPDLRNSQEGLLNLPHYGPCSFSSSGQPRLCCSGFYKPPLSLSLTIFPSLASSSSFESVLLASRPLQEMRGPQLINLQTLDEARLSTVSLEWIMPCSSRFSTAHSRNCQTNSCIFYQPDLVIKFYHQKTAYILSKPVVLHAQFCVHV